MNRSARFTSSMLAIIPRTSIMSPLIHLLPQQNHHSLFNLPSPLASTATGCPQTSPDAPALGLRQEDGTGGVLQAGSRMGMDVETHTHGTPRRVQCPSLGASALQWGLCSRF